MNSQFPNFVAAQLAYDRRSMPEGRWHSEADRQEHIGKLATENEKQITAALMTDYAEAQDIAVDLFGNLEEDKCVKVLRLLLSADPAGLLFSTHTVERLRSVQKQTGGSRHEPSNNREKKMNRYHLTVRTESEQYQYSAIQKSAIEAMLDAIDLFGLCAVTVRPA